MIKLLKVEHMLKSLFFIINLFEAYFLSIRLAGYHSTPPPPGLVADRGD